MGSANFWASWAPCVRHRGRGLLKSEPVDTCRVSLNVCLFLSVDKAQRSFKAVGKSLGSQYRIVLVLVSNWCPQKMIGSSFYARELRTQESRSYLAGVSR